MRILEKDTIEGLHGCIIGASTFSQGIRPNLWVPLGKEVTKHELDLLDRVRWKKHVLTICVLIKECPLLFEWHMT